MLVTLGTFNDGKLTLEKKLLPNDKITASCPINIPQAVYQTLQTTKMNFEKLLG